MKHRAIKFQGSIDIDVYFAAGWGRIDANVSQVSEDLMAVTIPVIPMAICNSTISYNGVIPSGEFCAGYMEGGRDSCQVKYAFRCRDEISKLIKLAFMP